MKKILILGATSAIAQETAKLFAKSQSSFYLVGRNREKLLSVVSDLTIRGASRIGFAVEDLDTVEKHLEIFQDAARFLGEFDIIFIAYGSLPNQAVCQVKEEEMRRVFWTNLISPASFITIAANHLESQKKGCLVVITSVAGDRGRQTNYVYGAAKGGLSLFLQGLRSRLAPCGVNVLTIKPGFVDTPMTSHLKKGVLFSSPDVIADGIYKAILNKKGVVYLPVYWKWIMAVVKWIPESFFNLTIFKTRKF